MAKRLTLLGMIVAAVAAFAVPSVASAGAVLQEGSTTVALGAQVDGTSFNATTVNTALGTLECGKVTVIAEVTENSGSSVKASGEEAETAICSASGEPLTVTNPSLQNLVTSGGGTGTLGLSFIADVGPFECQYEGEGAFSYMLGSSTVSIAGIALTSAPEFCEPEAEQPSFSGDFALTTASDGTPVTFNVAPVWDKKKRYLVGSKVEWKAGSGKCYEALAITEGEEPPANPPWEPVTC